MRIFAPQYTQAPNQLFDDWLPKLNFVQLKVLMVILRKTFGWHKVRDRISISQLEELTGAQRQAIIKAAKDLEKMGLITKIVVGSKGQQQTFYELIVIDNSNKSYQCDQHTTTSVINTPTKETLPKETESPIVPKGDKIPSKSKKEEREEKRPRVWITPSQEEDLLRRLKGDKQKLEACYDRLSAWKIEKMIDASKYNYKAIVEWVIGAVEKDLINGKASNSASQFEIDKQFVEKIKAKIPTHKDIVYGYNYIEFNFTAHNNYKIMFGSNGFKAQVESNLRKMGIEPNAL